MGYATWSKDPSNQRRQCFRKPVRLTATVSASVQERLILYSEEQGRSVSNLIAYILEEGLDKMEQRSTNQKSTHEED